jgi:hypothetical protein
VMRHRLEVSLGTLRGQLYRIYRGGEITNDLSVKETRLYASTSSCLFYKDWNSAG